jgi:hypothetical protein
LFSKAQQLKQRKKGTLQPANTNHAEANKQGKGKGEQQLKLSPPITKRPCPEANKQGKGCTKLIDFVDT